MRDYLEIIGENHGHVVSVHVTLLLKSELLLRPPAGNSIHIGERVEENSGFLVEEADAALAIRPT